MASFIPRVALIMGGWTTLHLGVVAALAHDITPGGWWAYLALWLAILGAMAVVLSSFREDAWPGKWTRLLVMRPFWYAQMAILPMSVVGGLAWLVGLPFGRALPFAHVALAVLSIVLALLFVVGYIGAHALVVRKLEFRFPDLPPAFDGLTIAQLSDLHVGPHTNAGHLRRIVRAVEKEQPDIIAFTGDQVDDYHEDTARFAQVFGGLRAPLGVFAIAGNHDVYAGWPGVRRGMEAAGMRVLVNEAVPVAKDGAEIWVLGTGDPAGASAWASASASEPVAPDIPRALSMVPPGSFVLGLAHNPALWPPLARAGVHVTLSGHTHHGQLSIPALKWSLASPFLELAMGTHAREASVLYINPGTNYWALPLRVGAWPEVTLVTLRRGSPEA